MAPVAPKQRYKNESLVLEELSHNSYLSKRTEVYPQQLATCNKMQLRLSVCKHDTVAFVTGEQMLSNKGALMSQVAAST